jgi:hypothetical protein
MNTARELSNRLAELLRNERNALAEFILALAAFDRDRRWIDLGHKSLFAFLTHDLGLSKGAAFYRMTAAQLVERHPEVVEPLRDGRLCLTVVVELAKVLNDGNAADVLPRFFHLSKLEAKEVVATLSPTPAPTRTVVTPVRIASRAAAPMHAPEASGLTSVSWLDEPVHANSERSTQEGAARSVNLSPAQSAPSSPFATTVIEPKTADLSRVHVTVPRTLLRKLATARDALSHSHPGASDAEILEAGLDLLLDRAAKRRGLVKNPRRSAPATQSASPSPIDGIANKPRTRYVPAEVRRAVWERDGGKCQWPLEGGGVCGSTRQVELDHIEPFAKGGPTTIDGSRLLCRFHQDVSARRAFGNSVMDRYTGKRRRSAPGG